MMTNPTKEHREQGREIVYADINVAKGQVSERLIERVADALSSRDKEIREVLEGLSYFVTFSDGKKVRHWCARHEACSPACKAAAALYAKTQTPEDSNATLV